MAHFPLDPRIARLREQNHLNAKTRVFPPEILSSIFYFAHLLNLRIIMRPKNYIPTTFAAVCSDWRYIAFGTPELWTRITITFTGSVDVPSKAGFLALHINNSGALPLIVGLRFGKCDSDPGLSLVHSSVDDLIWRNAHRISDFSLFTPPSSAPWKSFLPHLSQLDCFRFQPTESDPQEVLQLSEIPSLSCVYLTSFRGQIILDGNAITHLQLAGAPIDTCFRLLLQCPNLILYGMYEPLEPVDDDQNLWVLPPKEHSITMARLKSLTWEFCGSRWDIMLLERIHTPVLECLTWADVTLDDDEDQLDLTESAKAFCKRLPASLDSVYIKGFADDTCVLHHFRNQPNLQTIQVDISTREQFLNIVSPLGPSKITDGATPFPKLNLLSLVGDGDCICLNPKESGKFLNTLVSRAKVDQILHVNLIALTLSVPGLRVFPKHKMDALQKKDQIYLHFEDEAPF